MPSMNFFSYFISKISIAKVDIYIEMMIDLWATHPLFLEESTINISCTRPGINNNGIPNGYDVEVPFDAPIRLF